MGGLKATCINDDSCFESSTEGTSKEATAWDDDTEVIVENVDVTAEDVAAVELATDTIDVDKNKSRLAPR